MNRATLDLQDVVDTSGALGILSEEAQFVAAEDSNDNVLSLDDLGLQGEFATALARVCASVSLGQDGLVYSPQPDFAGFDLVVLVGESGLPKPVYVWVASQNDPPILHYENYSFQWFTWELAYLNQEPFTAVNTGRPNTKSIDVLKRASNGSDVGERLRIIDVTASHGATVEVSSPDESSASSSWPDNDAIRYLPAPGFSGVETITYTVSDENGGTVQGTVTVDIEDRNDVVRYRLEARDGAGHVVDHVRPGDMVDVYVFAKDQSGLDTEGIVWAASSVTYDSKQIELAGDVQFGEELPNLQWWGDGKFSASPDLHHLGFQAAAGFNRPTSTELLVAHFPMKVVGDGVVQLEFQPTRTEATLGKGYQIPYDGFRDVPWNAIESVDLQLPVIAGWHNTVDPVDVNDDGVASPIDALLIINAMNNGQTGVLVASEGESSQGGQYLDVNDDGLLTPIDALLVLNYLNSTSAEGEYTGVVSHSAVAAALQETPTVTGVNYGGGTETARSNLEVAVPALRELLPIDCVLSEANGQYDAAPRASAIDSADEALLEAIDDDLVATLALSRCAEL